MHDCFCWLHFFRLCLGCSLLEKGSRIENCMQVEKIKVKKIEGRVVSLSPEFEDCKEIAERGKLSLQEVYRRVERDARSNWGIE